ncbi:hypothetical protein BJ944DRAFT_264870 [Cunninghamella echinulata]|nr:hypothetical protein BJ944DRAFT_264870 [Cunninghamella echinulata]
MFIFFFFTEVIQIKFTNSEQSTRRKSRSLHQSSSPPKIKSRSSSILKNQHPHHHNKVSMIRCICTTPNEEFGAMVQCDDCASWLHLDCLALDEHALDETFRCPSCFITLGPGQHHLTSSLTWRFAAQIKSKRLASRKQKKKLSNDKKKFYQRYHQRQDYYSSSSEDESDYQQPDWVIKEQEQELQQQKQQQQSVLKNKKDQEEEENIDSDTTETDWEINLKRKKLEISISNNSNNNNSSSSSRTTPSLPSLSPSQPIHSGCSSDLDSPSEASTPDHEDGFFHHHSTMTNNFIHSTATSSTCLMDNESLMWLSRLAYLESLQTSCNSHQQQCFMPNASDVFLCEQQQQQRNHHHLSSSSPSSSSSSPLPLLLVPTLSTSSSSSSSSITNRSDLPSTICSQDLSQYSFDDGPFWSPIQ